MVRIEILAGPEAGRVVEMTPGVWRVGRAKDNELVLAVESVSSHHLQLEVGADGSVRFKDLGSTNGTFSAGVQVKEGEWFLGSELRLGGCALKLLAADEAGLLAEAKADDASSSARAAALAGPRRSPAVLALGALVVLGLAGAGVWWFLLRDGGGARPQPGAALAGTEAGVAQDVADLLGGLGQFADAEAWQLTEGLSVREGSLTNGAGRSRATLLRNFDLSGGGLLIAADVTSLKCQAIVSFGSDEEYAQPWAAWSTADLGASPLEFALPEGARWFQIALQVEGGGSVKNLRVESQEAAVAATSVPPGRIFVTGGNLLLMQDEQTVLAASASGGAWTAETGGIAWKGATDLSWSLGPALLAVGGLVMSDGGPVGISAGVRVEASPGLLLGVDPRRLLVHFEPAAIVQSTEAGLRVEGATSIRLSWDLGSALAEAARLGLEINQAINEGNDPRLLAATARLLRDLPLDDAKNQAALAAQRGALERGQTRLLELKAAVAGALLVRSVDIMEVQAERAGQLATTFAGSTLGDEAGELAAALRDAVAAGREAEQAAQAEWHARLQTALIASYPAIAGWIGQQDAATSGGGQ
jgi:hypothetical protein